MSKENLSFRIKLVNALMISNHYLNLTNGQYYLKSEKNNISIEIEEDFMLEIRKRLKLKLNISALGINWYLE